MAPVPGSPGIDPCRSGSIAAGLGSACTFAFALFTLRGSTPHELGLSSATESFGYLLPAGPALLRAACALAIFNALLSLAILLRMSQYQIGGACTCWSDGTLYADERGYRHLALAHAIVAVLTIPSAVVFSVGVHLTWGPIVLAIGALLESVAAALAFRCSLTARGIMSSAPSEIPSLKVPKPV